MNTGRVVHCIPGKTGKLDPIESFVYQQSVQTLYLQSKGGMTAVKLFHQLISIFYNGSEHISWS